MILHFSYTKDLKICENKNNNSIKYIHCLFLLLNVTTVQQKTPASQYAFLDSRIIYTLISKFNSETIHIGF